MDEVAVAVQTAEDLEHALLALVERTWRDLQPEAPLAVRVDPDSSLDRDLGFDSLARVELMLRIEREFGVDLHEDTLQRAESVRDLLLAVKQAAPHAAPRAARFEQAATSTSVARSGGAESGVPEQATTLLEALAWHVRVHAGQTHIVCLDEDREHAISYAQLDARARAIAGGLQRAGVAPRQAVALMLPTAPEYFFAFVGVLMAGGIPVPIYPPARASQLEEHVLRHAGILANAQAVMLVTVPEAKMVARLLQARVPGLRQVVTPAQLQAEGAAAPVSVRADDIAFIQYTSGSTGHPKGVVLTHANLLANLRAMQKALAVTPADVFVSWLPLYHDMGLIGGFLGSLYVGYPLVVMSPLAFLSKPQRWLWAIHRHRGTLSAAPNFAYELCLRRLDDEALAGLDLSSWRLVINGAEAVNPDTLERVAARFAPYGVRAEAITPVYGLAEASLGLLFPPLGRGPRIDRVQREPFTRTGRAVPAAPAESTALRFVACGRPLAGHPIRIVDDAGVAVGERVEGRLEFKGPSATQGYFRNPAETARLFDDGWVDTGDRAYLADDDVYLTGRVKDVVIRAGRNIYPQEIEEAAGAVAGIRKGCVAAFGSADRNRGTERLVVLAETQTQAADARARLREAVARAVIDVLGEPPDEVVLAPPHTVLKTSSGKLRRSACRMLYEEGRIGAGAPSAQHQVVRLAAGTLVPLAKRAAGATAARLFALYAMAVFVLLGVVTWLATFLTRTPAAAWRLSGASMRLVLRLTGTPFDVRGLEHLPAGPCVLVGNHASYLDGLILVAALPRPYAFVAKRELLDQFIPRTYLTRLGSEFVERFDVKRSVEDANRMADAVARGRSLIVFPEGTFVAKPGLLPFHLGAFLAAAGAGAPVVPIVIRGTRDVLPADRWLPRRGAISVEIGAPVLPPPRAQADVFSSAVKLRSAARAGIAQRLPADETSTIPS